MVTVEGGRVERDPDRRGGWLFRPRAPIAEPLDYVVPVTAPAGESPVELHLVFTDDGLYVPAVVRKPPGPGPFPAVMCMHGGSGGLGITWLVERVLNYGFVFDRLLEEGYVICYTEGRQEIEEAYGTDNPAVLDHMDLINTYRYVQRLPYVDPQRIGFFGVSHGGEIQMKLISKIQEGPAALVPGEPAVIEYLGLKYQSPRSQASLQFNADLSDSQIDFDRAWERIQRISPSVPILVLGRDTDHLQGLFRKLYELLERAGKNVRWASWDHPVHTYQWGPRRTGPAAPYQEGSDFGKPLTEIPEAYEAEPMQKETLDYVVAFLNEHVRK